jgi:nucleoside phosphorylase
VARIPVYFSHSYRRGDRGLNDHFWRAFSDAGFSFTVDPGSTSLSTTMLELMMARSAGYAAVVTYRPEHPRYQCSPFILYEYGLAVLGSRPRLVLRDKRVSPRHFQAPGTLMVEFDDAAPDRCAVALDGQLEKFRELVSVNLTGRAYRRGKVGLALAGGAGDGAADAATRRRAVEDVLDAGGDDVVDLARVAEDASELAETVDGCDFVVVDLDDGESSRIAEFLLGRGVPMLKLARRGSATAVPDRLIGAAPLRRVTAADELITYWSEPEDFESRVRQQIGRVLTDRTEFADFEDGHRYFRSLGRESWPVFLSNAGTANDVARDLAQALRLENIPFFHYRFHNTIGFGQRWAEELESMVAASKIFVPLIDGSYWDSTFCGMEYEAARRLADAGRLTIVPALLDGYDPRRDVPYQGHDLRELPRREQIDLVVRNLDQLLVSHDVKGDPTAPSDAGTPLVAEAVSVDVAIITILEQEYEAVLRLLTRVRQVVGSEGLDNQHAWVVGEVDSPQHAAPYTVGLALSPRAGTNAAVIATKNTLQALDPRCVLVVGVAGGLGGLQPGDVVVADRICAYEYGKIDRGFHPRDDLDAPTDSALTSHARTLPARHQDWYSRLDQPEELRGLSPTIVVGHVASGDKVVDDPSDAFFESVRRSRPKLRAVEMEGAGVAAAIQDAREMQRPISFGMIRGISDVPREGGSQPGRTPGESRQTEIRDAWKAAASAAAAACAVQLIRLSWPRPPRARAGA